MLTARASARMKITMGPVLFNWPTPMWTDFYARIADEAPVDRVVIGEVVCSKRTPFRTNAISGVVERLERAGKEVVIATLAMPTLQREINEVLETATSGRLVEVNDTTALAAVAGKPHVVGPLLNIYNEHALAKIAALGSKTVCLPIELPLTSIRVLGSVRGTTELEAFAFGRAPLAISARCYHARAHQLTKDSCKYVCEQDLDGLQVETLDGESFLAINGVQTMASGFSVLANEIVELAGSGVTRIRLSPHTCNMVRIATAYKDLIDGRIGSADLLAQVEVLRLPGPIVNGFVHGTAGAKFAT
jgi:collagenase-like PrtC family protease